MYTVCMQTFIATFAYNYGLVIGNFRIDCLRPFVVAYKLVLLMLYCW